MLPSTLPFIPRRAFQDTQLTKVVIPEGVTSVEDGAFFNAPLSGVVLPAGLEIIGSGAFSETEIRKVLIPPAIQIAEDAFDKEVEQIVLSPVITRAIAEALFDQQGANVVIPDGSTSIDNFAFQNIKLDSVVIPESVASIGIGAFSGAQLSNIFLPGGSEVGPSAFDPGFDLDLNIILEGLTTSRGNVVGRDVGLTEPATLWLQVNPETGFQALEPGSGLGNAALLLAGNTSQNVNPRQADPLLALLLKDPEAIGGWRGLTPLIWRDSNNDGFIDDGEGGELQPFGIYAGDLHVFDADGNGLGDLATVGFGAGTRRAADGSTLAIPETNLFLFDRTLEDGTPSCAMPDWIFMALPMARSAVATSMVMVILIYY